MQKSRFKLQLGPNFCKQLRRVITFVRTQWSALAAFAAVSFSRSSRGLKCTEDTAAAAEEGAEDAEAAAATGAPSIAEEEASKQTRHCLTRLQSHSRRERHIKGGTGRKVAHFTLLRGKKLFKRPLRKQHRTAECEAKFLFLGSPLSYLSFSTFPPTRTSPLPPPPSPLPHLLPWKGGGGTGRGKGRRRSALDIETARERRRRKECCSPTGDRPTAFHRLFPFSAVLGETGRNFFSFFPCDSCYVWIVSS